LLRNAHRFTPALAASPTITDSVMSIIGISRDRTTLIGANTTVTGQIYYSTDDGTTWSAALLGTPDAATPTYALETEDMELFLTYSNTRFINKTTGWASRTTGGGTVASTGLISSRASGIYPYPFWSSHAYGEIALVCEYGAKSNSPLTNNARYVYMSKDMGQKWFTIFDLQGADGANITPVAGGYHMHAVAYDPWGGRVWVTHGDTNDGIWYSDDAHLLQIFSDIATTASSTTITTNTAFTSFTAADVGKQVRGGSIPAGTTIASITNQYTAVLSQAATATASNVVVAVGSLTWNKLRYGRSGRFQVTAIIPAPEGVYFGSDGYPTGLHLSRRVSGGRPGALENVLRTAPYSTGTGAHLCSAYFRARDLIDAPVLVAWTNNSASPGGALALIHADGKRTWKLWDDPYVTSSFSSFISIFYTAAGNIVGTLQSARTGSGYQMFKVAMPSLPRISD
jgi:hypothetical protein